MPGVIRLGAFLEQEEKEYNLIEQLKTNDIINSYFWMINYILLNKIFLINN